MQIYGAAASAGARTSNNSRGDRHDSSVISSLLPFVLRRPPDKSFRTTKRYCLIRARQKYYDLLLFLAIRVWEILPPLRAVWSIRSVATGAINRSYRVASLAERFLTGREQFEFRWLARKIMTIGSVNHRSAWAKFLAISLKSPCYEGSLFFF